ncbi:surface protein [Streptomyces flavovirens]|nr:MULTISPECIES: surface protein [unclassified Streptomyces]MYU37524.1 surface protein [Streptomyces sp. SID8358]MYX74976.1 surface protein [Streptomyces sp. SID3915]
MDTEPPVPSPAAPGGTGSAPPVLLLAGEQEDTAESHIVRGID